MIPVILDTDIGPDCDDAGALALLHTLAREVPLRILAMTNCTSNPYANGAIDVINRAYGQNDIPIGMYDKPGFLCDEKSEVYNKALCLNYENRFQENQTTPKALDTIKKALTCAEDNSVIFIATGPLNNLADLLKDNDGFELVRKKVKHLVTMSCGMEQVEWNVEMDIPSARLVFEKWPTAVTVTPFETGLNIITGVNFKTMDLNHPVRVAYKLFNEYHGTGSDGIGRNSWDLTAVWAAIKGSEPFFSLTEPHNLYINSEGMSIYTPDPNGKVRFLQNKMSEKEIGREIDSLWCD